MTVQSLSPDRTRFVTSLWELAADGSTGPRRLTYSEKGEGAPVFLPDGSMAFGSSRPDPTLKEDEAEGRVWLLPAGAGEARSLLSVPGGVEVVAAAREAPVIVLRTGVFPGAAELGKDAEKAKRRKEAGTSAMLFDAYPVRYWDRELGPRGTHLLRLGLSGEVEDLVADPGGSLREADFTVSPDGRTTVTTWRRPAGRGFAETDLVAVESGGTRTLATGADFGAPEISPDGRRVVAVRERRGDPGTARDLTLWMVDLETGEGRDLTPDLDLWPLAPVWAPDGRSLYFGADERGHCPIFRLDPETGEVRRLTSEGAFSSICPSPDGGTVFALRSTMSSPAEVVRVDPDGSVTALPTPGLPLEVAGRVVEVTATADDGAGLRAWLMLPEGASAEHPAPLALWVHGGPLSSFNAWSWRWCPYLLTERGYAVLMPDPSLSTGYGHAFIQRAWGRWGPRVFDDLMAITDAALQRGDLDGSRTAAMGGSFGGYMANWIAGHTDRFRAIVSHAGLWSLDQFHGTTDNGTYWEREMGDPYLDPTRWRENSPSRSLGEIRTPMLVIHGLRDYRVPISEALREWTDLQRHGVPAKYLFFPDENHWILKPGNAQVWYETVLAFLDHHVLGKEWRQPDLL
ncbi:MAG: S9 family peptidase [Candidatus Dormibacteraeota bacterium]|nr:S9 family peptidase [Candidatus Dormibacteraeota bacterium]